MFIYHITTKITWDIHDAWVAWMKEKHIPDIMQTGCFTGYRLVRLLETDEEEGPTYAAQYEAATRESYEHYLEGFADALRKEAMEKWGNRFMSFRSVMQVVN